MHGDKEEYEWPLDKVSIQEQCEQLLSTKIWTTRTEQRGDFLSLEALNNLFDPETDDEWRPHDMNTMDTRTREHIVHHLRDFGERDHPLADMYDIRLIPLDSHFCDKQPASNNGAIEKVINNFREDLKDMLGGSGENIEEIFPETQKLLQWESNESASIASIKYSCPCIPVNYKSDNLKTCGISAKVCEIVPASLPELDRECSAVDLDTDVLEYDAELAPAVRRMLRDPKHAGTLRNKGFVCPTFLPSASWHFGSEPRDFLLHGASGVTATNLDFVTQNLGAILGEDHRTVAFENLSIPLCGGGADPSQIENASFPAANLVAVSPAVVACVRYIVDSVWVHALRQAKANNVEEAEVAAEIWRTRCQAKVNKLESCRRYGAYHFEIESVDKNEDCPYDTILPSLRMRRAACLVQQGNDFYDPFKCKKCSGAERCVIDSSEIVDKCKVANPLRILAKYTDKEHAHGVPGLSYTFVQDVMHRKDSSVRDLLFPETGVDTSRWFKVWHNGDTTPSIELRTSQVFDDILQQDPDAREVALTAEQQKQLPAYITSRHYFSKGDYAWFPKALAGEIEAHSHEEHGACFHSLPYWPPTWQAPLGESMSERPADAAGFANYLAVVDGAEVRVLHRVLHSENESERYYGTTGACREHNIGMPLADLNTHRLCTTDTETNREVCSKSAQVDTGGGGFGKTLGPLFHVLRFWLENDAVHMTRGDFWDFTHALDRAAGDDVSEDNVAELLRTQCDTFPERLDRVLRDLEYRPDDRECNTTAECEEREPGTVCHADARCRGLEVDVLNEASETVEMGFASPGCDTSPGVSGASPWKRARHFLAQHGMCAHRNTITYERMLLALNNSNNTYKECELRTLGNWSYFECARNTTEWDWIRENPRWWARKAGPGVLPGEPEYNMRSVGDLGEFDLDPHPCDYDVMHAHDWGFCKASHTKDTQGTYSHWMRLAASHDNFTVYRDREDAIGDEISEDNDGWNKLRFLGLEKAALRRDKAAQEPRVAPCRNFGYCEAGDHRIGGVQVYRYIMQHESNTSVFYEMDNVEWCGPMGYLVEKTPTRKCALDPAVTQLFSQAANESMPCYDVFGPPQNILEIFSTKTAPWVYRSEDRDTVRFYLNQYFSLERAANLGARKNRTWHENLTACARDVATEGRLLVNNIRTGHPKQPLPVNVTPGIYLFFEYAAAEVPVLWWHKYALMRALNGETLGSERQYRADELQSRAVAANVPAYRGRGALPASGTKLGTMWASLNTAKVFDRAATLAIFFKTTARWLKKSFESGNNRLSFARPYRLALNSRTTGLDQYEISFMTCFESAVFQHAKDNTGILPHVCHSKDGTKRNSASLTLRDQFYSPFVVGNRGNRLGSLNAMFVLEEDPDFFESTHDILYFFEILVRSVYEKELSPEQQRQSTTLFDPYKMTEVVDTVQDGNKAPGLPILRIQIPDSTAWGKGIENQLEDSIVEFLDSMEDDSGEHSFKPNFDISRKEPEPHSECLFSMDVAGSVEHLSTLERGEHVQEKTWKDAVFVYDDNKKRTFNLCDPGDEKNRAFLRYNEGLSSRGPSCTFGNRREAAGEDSYSLSYSGTDFEIDASGYMNRGECIDSKCCPDHLLYNSIKQKEGAAIYREHEPLVSFASLYKTSNQEYMRRQRTRFNARCIRTDSTCFAPGAEGPDFAKNAWQDADAQCRRVHSMQVPSIFKVKAYGIRDPEMRVQDLLSGDRVLLHEITNLQRRVLFSLQKSGNTRIMAAPPWSFCPSDTDKGFFMHKFKKIDLSSAKDKFQNETDISKLESFDRELAQHKVYIPKNTIYSGADYSKYLPNSFSVLQKRLTLENNRVRSVQFGRNKNSAMDNELNKYKSSWCNPGNARDSVLSVYQIGLCFDDLIFADDYKTKKRETICEYLGKSFETTYVGYFPRNMLATRDILEVRVTDFMHPINPKVPALQPEAMSTEQLWIAIAQGIIPRDENGDPLLEFKKDVVTYGELMDAFMSSFCSVQLYGGVWDDKCELLKDDGKLYRRHLLNNFKWLNGEEGDKKSDKLLAPCIVAKASFRDVSHYPSSNRISANFTDTKTYLERLPKAEVKGEDCWKKCQETEGLCPQFCGGGACCQSFLRGICNSMNWGDGLGILHKHSCREIYDIQQEHPGDDPDKIALARRDTVLDPPASLLPAMDVAIDYIDTEGWCKNGGSERKLNLFPDQWSEVNKIVSTTTQKTHIWIPCPPKCEDVKEQSKSECQDCLSILKKIDLNKVPHEEETTYTTRSDANNLCSIEIEMDTSELEVDTSYVCGADTNFAYDQCRHAQEEDLLVEVYTEYALTSARSVAWTCRPCLKYKTAEFVDFATSSNLTKLSWGLYFNEQPVYQDIDSQGALQKLKDALRKAMETPETSRAELQSVLDDENKVNNVNFTLRQEDDGGTNYEIYYDAEEMQQNVPLPPAITDSFREFGHDPPQRRGVGCELTGTLQEEDDECGVPYNDVNTEIAYSASEQLKISLLGGCRAQEQDTQVHKSACTPYVAEHDTRYHRIKAFHAEVLSREFALRLPEIAADGGNARLNIDGANWLRGVLAYYAYSSRPGDKPGSVYLDYIFNDQMRCKTMYRYTLLERAPCFEDHNGTVNLLNPWLGGNYSFMNYFANLVADSDEYKDKEDVQKLLQAGFDTCTEQQTVHGENLQPCQGFMCIPLQSMAAIHPDDVNRTVCRFSSILNEPYKRFELLPPTQLEIIADIDNRGRMYRIPNTPTLCDAEYKAATANSICTHEQATLGFAPAQQRGRATPAPSLNRSRTDAGQRVAERIAKHTFRVGQASMADLLWAGTLYDRELHGDKPYFALLVAPEQTAPARVRLKVSRGGALLVHDVGQLDSGVKNPGVAWVANQHLGVAQDQKTVRSHGLYRALRDAPGHWACPFFVREAVTGARFPALHVLQPDPSQARAAFPGLDGAHPALRTRPVLPAQLARYRMLGLHRVVQGGSHAETFTHEEARALARAFLRNNGTMLDVDQGASNTRNACLRWPNIHPQSAALRSDENYTQHTACPGELRSDLSDVFAGRTLVRVSPENDALSAEDAGGAAAASAHACFRAPLVAMRRAEFDRLSGDEFLRCRDTTAGRAVTERNISCWKATGAPTVFTFPTTHRPGRGRRYWETPRRNEGDKCWEHGTGSTRELSMYARQRLSPLRSRLRRANLTHREPLQVWADGVRRMQEENALAPQPVPELNANIMSGWGLCGSAQVSANLSLERWDDPAQREQECKEQYSALAQNEDCNRRETFIDLCNFAELRGMCATLRGAMQYFLRLNMAAGGHLLRPRMHYMPDRYMHGDGEFASTAVVAKYRELAEKTAFVCQDWRFSDDLLDAELQTNDRVHRDACVEIMAATLIQRMGLLRQVALGIIDFVLNFTQLIVDVLMYIGLSFLGSTSGVLQSIRENLGTSIIEQLEEIGNVLLELLKDIADTLIQLFIDLFLGVIQQAILWICGIIESIVFIIISIVNFFRQVFQDESFDVSELRDINFCYNAIERWTGSGFAAEPAQSLIADQCFTAIAGVGMDLPSGFLNNPRRRFTCGLTSMCLRDSLAVPEENKELALSARGKYDYLPAIPCGRCPDRIFACDSAQKRCKCGVSIPAATACTTTAFCRDPAQDAVCRFSQDGDPDFSTLAQRCAEINTDDRFIACVYSSLDAEGQCQALPAATAQSIGPSNMYGVVRPFSFFDASATCESIESFGIVRSSTLLPFSPTPRCVRIGMDSKFNVPMYDMGLGGRARRLLAIAYEYINMTAVASTFVLGIDVVLEPASPRTRSGGLDATAEDPGTGMTVENHDRIAGLNTTAAARRLLAAMAFQHLNFSALEAFRDTLSLSQSAGVDFTLLPLTDCTSSKTVQFEFFLRNFAEQLAGPRWRARPECTSGDTSLLERLTQPCPVVQNVFDRLANNTAVLAQYYLHVTNSGCLDVNSNKSCVPEINRTKRESASELWPWFPEHDYRRADLKQWNISSEGCGDNIPLYDPALRDVLDVRGDNKQDKSMFELSTEDQSKITTVVSMYHCVKSANRTGFAYLPTAVEVSNTSANQSVAVQSITSAVNFITVDIFALNKQYYSSLFFNVISLEAMHNDDEYERMIERHEYSVGRMVRDFTTCSYRDTVFCPQQQHSLLLCFVTMFVFLLLVTSLLPIPSVLTFFMWTLGLTVGVVYLAYGFSPLCAPLVPNCLGDGLRDTLMFFFPKKLTLPQALIDTSVCYINGTRLPGQTGDCLKSCRTLNVYGALDVLMHAEAFFTSGVYFGLTWEPANATGCKKPNTKLQDFMTANVNGEDTVVLRARDHAQALKDLPVGALKCDVTYCAKGGGSPAWRPVGGLPVTDVIVHAVRRVLEPWIGSEDALWVVLRDKECHALENVHTDDNDQRLGVFICMLLGVFDVLAWGIVLLLGIPVFIYVVQYFVLLNLVLLQIFMDNYIVANREF